MARRRRRVTLVELLIGLSIAGIIAAIVLPAIRNGGGATPGAGTGGGETADTDAEAAAAALAEAERRLGGAPPDGWEDGLAALVLVDVSGSMSERVRDAGGARPRKLGLAQRAAAGVINAFGTYASAHPGTPVQVGVYEFSSRDGQPAARPIVPLAPPDVSGAVSALARMKADGGTPIGDAMIDARRALDATRLRRRHLVVLTDGENTDGLAPDAVARAMDRQPDDRRAQLYLIAFDVDASVFAPVRQTGAMLLSARDGAELAATFSELLSDRILVEAPRN